MTEVWLAFMAGLAGSGHCLGMCGGIVAALAMTRRHQATSSRILFQLLYNLGRVTTYTLLGVAAGMIGASMNLLALRSVALWVFCAANVLVIAVGLASALKLSWLSLSSLESNGAALLAAPLRSAMASSSALAGFPLGLVLGFLPCGLVYAPLMVAAGTGRPLLAGAIMAALGLGTMPLLFVFGSASTAISGAVRDLMFRCAGVIVALMGMMGLWRVLSRMGH